MAEKRTKMATKAKTTTSKAKKTTAKTAKVTKVTKVVKAATKVRKATAKVGKTTTKVATTKPKTTTKTTTTKRKTTTTKAATTPKVTTPKVLSLSTAALAKKQTKAQIVADLSSMTGVTKSDIRNLFIALRNLVERHMNTKGSGQFAIPELGIKVRRVNKKATKARMGRNPFTGEEIKIPAKPARKAVRATVLKSLKEVV